MPVRQTPVAEGDRLVSLLLARVVGCDPRRVTGWDVPMDENSVMVYSFNERDNVVTTVVMLTKVSQHEAVSIL